LDSRWKFKYSKRSFRRSRNSNSGIRFWWIYRNMLKATEEYDGSAWTAGGNLSTADIVQQEQVLKLLV
jgi:hypothetical protein